MLLSVGMEWIGMEFWGCLSSIDTRKTCHPARVARNIILDGLVSGMIHHHHYPVL